MQTPDDTQKTPCEFRVGDTVRCLRNSGIGAGIIYKVTNVSDEPEKILWGGGRRPAKLRLSYTLKLTPAFMIFGSDVEEGRARGRTLTEFDVNIERIGIIELGQEYNRFGLFITEEMRRLQHEGR